MHSKVKTGITPYEINEESDWFKFYYELFENQFYIKLSNEAKLLYCLLRDRTQLSIKNKWVNENNIAYVYFSYDQVQDILKCSRAKAGKLFKELRVYNLIIAEYQGQMKPNRIYVQHFNCREYKYTNEDEQGFVDIPKSFYKLTVRKPDINQVKTFAEQFGNNLYLSPEHFYKYNQNRDWFDDKGNEIKNWKGLFTAWNERKRINGANKISLGNEKFKKIPPFSDFKNSMSYEEYLDKFFPIDPEIVKNLA